LQALTTNVDSNLLSYNNILITLNLKPIVTSFLRFVRGSMSLIIWWWTLSEDLMRRVVITLVAIELKTVAIT